MCDDGRMRSLPTWLLLLTVACEKPGASHEEPTTATASPSGSVDRDAAESSRSASRAETPDTAPTASDRAPEPVPTTRGGLWGDEGDPRRPKRSALRMGATSVNGRLPPEVIQRIVRSNFGKLRLCYDTALASDGTVGGRTATSFVITSDGATTSVKTTGDIVDKTMLACLDKAFSGLTYPTPESGNVKVVYPIVFAPPDYAFTIGEKPSANVSEADLVKALEKAGYKVAGAADASQPSTAVSHLKAEKGGVTFTLSLDTSAKLPLADYEELKAKAVTLEDGAWCLFVESSDKAASQALVDAIHKKLEKK